MAFFRKNKNFASEPAVATSGPASKKNAGVPFSEKDSGRIGVAYRILMHPLITEKSTLAGSLNQYAFMVDPRANKVEIKKAIEEVYHLRPTKVRVTNILGKKVSSGRRGHITSRKNWKKAIVTFPAGKKIDVYEGL